MKPRDRDLFKVKAYYFCLYAAAAAFIPFLVIFYERQGLRGSQIGLLTGLPPFISLFAAPLWGSLADLTQQHRRWQTLAILGAITSTLVLSHIGNFAALIPLVVIFALFAAPIVPFFDNAVMDLLGNRKDLYGRQRLWGAIGWGMSAPLIGLLIELQGLMWPFWGYAGLMGLGLLITWTLPASSSGLQESFGKGLGTILANRRWIAFLGMVFIGGMSFSIITNFLFLHLLSLGASTTLMGLSLTAATVSELPVLYFSGWLLTRWQARGLLVAAIFLLGIRLFSYSLLTAPWPVLIIQLLHGPTFSAIWVAGVSYADKIAPSGLGATAQGIFAGVLLGLGSGIGAVLGGRIYENLGAVAMFQVFSLLALAALALFQFGSRIKLISAST